MINKEIIPSHWDFLPIRSIFYESDKRNGDEEYELLSVTQDRGIIKQSGDAKKDTSNEDKSKYKVVLENSIAYNKMRMWQGAVGINEMKDGIVSPAYVVINPISKINTKYYFYLFKSTYMISQFGKYSYGLVDDMNSLRYDNFKNIYVPIPPLVEQNKIVKRIDKKSKQIDNFVVKKTEFIRLLKNQKEAIITKAISKGITSHIKYKQSDIEWLGNIPIHWELRKLKYCLNKKLKYGANESAELDNTDYPRYIRITDFGFDGALKTNTFKSLLPEVAENYLLSDGDILFARSGATVGKTFQFKNYNGKACFAGYLIKATVDSNIVYSDFLFLFTKSSLYARWKDFIFNKSTIENIGADKYAELTIPIPPLKEQTMIISYIESEHAKIDEIIEKTAKEIELIKEYKTSLISEVVSGQLKVG